MCNYLPDIYPLWKIFVTFEIATFATLSFLIICICNSIKQPRKMFRGNSSDKTRVALLKKYSISREKAIAEPGN